MHKYALFVDASCIGNPGPMEYRIMQGQIAVVGQKTHIQKGSIKQIYHSEIFPIGTNNIGEFLAIIDAIKYVKNMRTREGLGENIIIYTDSQTALHWLQSKKPKTTLPYNEQTKQLLTKLQEAIIRLKNTDISGYTIQKRETELRGEIPADFGRK